MIRLRLAAPRPAAGGSTGRRQALESGTRAGVERAAGRVLEEARQLAAMRSRTGKLAESLSMELSASGSIARVVAKAPYARFMEFGTRRNPARPFLGPAFRLAREFILRAIGRAMRQALVRKGKPRS